MALLPRCLTKLNHYNKIKNRTQAPEDMRTSIYPFFSLTFQNLLLCTLKATGGNLDLLHICKPENQQ